MNQTSEEFIVPFDCNFLFIVPIGFYFSEEKTEDWLPDS